MQYSSHILLIGYLVIGYADPSPPSKRAVFLFFDLRLRECSGINEKLIYRFLQI